MAWRVVSLREARISEGGHFVYRKWDGKIIHVLRVGCCNKKCSRIRSLYVPFIAFLCGLSESNIR